MLTLKNIYSLQTQYGVTEGNVVQADIKYVDYVENCRNYITANIPKEYSKTYTQEQKESTDYSLTAQFVEKHNKLVEGYITPEGTLDVDLLLQDLVNSVAGAGILTEALEDPEVDEIQINDKNTIFVQKKGLLRPYLDKNGRVMKFVSDDEITITLNRLIDDNTGSLPQFVDGNPVMSAKTHKKQYRVSAVHRSVNTRGYAPYDHPVTNAVIRKFKETKLTIDDVISSEAITPKMGRLLKLIGTANLKIFFVGPTGSGKTTLLNIVTAEIDPSRRIILIQNPTEVTFFERDSEGRMIRNAVHWESNKHISASQLIDTSLRQTPEIIIMGESREGEEFKQVLRAMQTGHILFGTYHSDSAAGAVHRFANEYSSVSGSSYTESLKIAAEAIDFVIVQFKFPDGRRRVLSMSEIIGIDDMGKVITNDIFKFEKTGDVEINEHGLKNVKGEFVQSGFLTEEIKDNLYSYGVSYTDIKEFCEPELKGAYSKKDIEILEKNFNITVNNPQIEGDKTWVSNKK